MSNEIISPLGQDSLDFDYLKNKYREYLIANSVIKDVDYEGSNISVYLDILAYIEKNINSTIALNANQTMLLLSNIRQNIIYESQALGYNITRPISSKQSIDITVTLGATESVTIPAWEKFTVGDYTFYNKTPIVLTEAEPTVTVDIVEGLYLDYTIDSNLRQTVTGNTDQITLPYSKAEHNNVTYRVKKVDDTDFSDLYTKTERLTSLSSDTNLFYEEIDPETQYLNIINTFAGQGNLLVEGDTYDITLLISSGSAANGILVCENSSTYTSNLNNEISLDITVNSASREGADTESDESIKRNAPQFYNTGERTVTAPDYGAFLELNSLVGVAKAWGGETMNPINLGHVYLSNIPQADTQDYLTALEEVEVLQFLRPMIATGRIFKHPNYLVVDYDIKILGTLVSIEDKQAQIETALTEFHNEFYGKFGTSYFEAKATRVVENLFLNEKDASVVVTVKPKIQLDSILFTQSTADLEIYIPNSSKRFYLVKGPDRIEIPNDRDDYYSYLLNGWTKVEDLDEALTITFSGTVNGKTVTEGTVENGTINGGTYDFKRIYLDAVEIGQFNIELDILNLTDITAELAVTEYIDINYSPEFNVVTEKSTVIRQGQITYV